MVDVPRLKAQMALKGENGRSLAKKMGVHENQIYHKLSTGRFTLNDCMKLIEILEIENPNEIFFAKEVT